MKPLAAVLFVAFLAAAIPAQGISSAEAEEFAAAVRANPRDPGSQRIIDLAQRLGKARDLAALDHLIVLRHAGILQVYTGAYRGDNPTGPSPEIEERLLREYDDPRISWALMLALWRYESPALAQRLLDDVAELARFRRERARRCRLVGSPPGGSAHLSTPPMGALGGRLLSGSSRSMARIECPADMEPLKTFSRATSALMLIGETSLPGMAQQVAPHIPALTALPPIDESARDAAPPSPGVGMASSLKSVARLMKATRYQPAGPSLMAALDALPGKELADFQAAWPLLEALAVMDSRPASETIARWIERRSLAAFPVETSPALYEMVWLLASVLPEGQVDVTALRDRVLANTPYASLERVSNAFRSVARANEGLREPRPENLVAWARGGNARMVRYLLEKGVPVDGRNEQGDTALIAAIPYQWEAQKLLIESGADLNARDRGGVTAFHKAAAWSDARSSDFKVRLDYYVAHRADVNAADNEGRAPLHAAATRSAETVRFLLAHGAAVDPRMKNGATPLHEAAMAGKVDAAAALLQKGAEVNAERTDNVGSGLTPLQIARDTRNAAMESLLLRHGARVNLAYLAKREALKAAGSVIAPLLGGGH